MIGRVMKGLRERRKLTQGEVAKKLGIPRTTYANYELEYREPDLNTIHEIAAFYNVSIGDITGEKFDRDIDVYSTEDILKKYNLKVDGKSMTEVEAKAFLAFVRTNRSLN